MQLNCTNIATSIDAGTVVAGALSNENLTGSTLLINASLPNITLGIVNVSENVAQPLNHNIFLI
ncbi:hypothetical protein II5_05923 [Bacillus cereus MSX-A1]|nr:hypothetical protein II5_05923 [Bacillus cereus MSX-A1]